MNTQNDTGVPGIKADAAQGTYTISFWSKKKYEPIYRCLKRWPLMIMYRGASRKWKEWGKNQVPPIKYNLKTLTKTQQNYSTIDKELLATYLAYEDIYYLTNGTILVHVYTDHFNISLFIKSTIPFTKRATMLVGFILANNVQVHLIPGNKNKMADSLSRLTHQER